MGRSSEQTGNNLSLSSSHPDVAVLLTRSGRPIELKPIDSGKALIEVRNNRKVLHEAPLIIQTPKPKEPCSIGSSFKADCAGNCAFSFSDSSICNDGVPYRDHTGKGGFQTGGNFYCKAYNFDSGAKSCEVRNLGSINCRDQFGDVAGYSPCGETRNLCTFSAQLNKKASCNSICRARGSKCITAFKNKKLGSTCSMSGVTSCQNRNRKDQICVCLR